MNHQGTVSLQTERLRFRRFALSDAESAYEHLYSDPDIAYYMSWDAHKEQKQTEEMIAQLLCQYEQPDFYRWAVTYQNSDAVIGSVSLNINDAFGMVADVSYTLGKSYWNQGIMTEALKAVLRFGLSEIGLNRIEAFHATNNPASGKVMQKAGMRYEGHLRQKYKSHGGFEDCDLYAIILCDL